MAGRHSIIVLSDDLSLTAWVASAMTTAGVAADVRRLPGPTKAFELIPQADLFVVDHRRDQGGTLAALHRLGGRVPRPFMAVLISDLTAGMATDLDDAGADALIRVGDTTALATFAEVRLKPAASEHGMPEISPHAAGAALDDFLALATDGFWERDPDLRFTFTSPAVASVLGHPADTLLGRREPEIDRAAFPDWPRLETRLRSRQPIRGLPYRIKSSDGSESTVTVNADPIIGEGEELRGFRGVFAGSASGSPTASSNVADLDTSATTRDLAVLGHIAGGLAHDFNNLLTVLHGNLQLLQLEPAVLAIPDIDEVLDCALSASREGACLSRTLSMFTPDRAVRLAPVDVNALLTDMQAMMRNAISSSIAFDLLLDPAGPKAMTDAPKLEAAVMNLVNNAKNAMADGGRLTITTMVCVRPRATDNGASVLPGAHIGISVQDTGIGMSEDVLARATHPFFSMGSDRKRPGLGLNMVDRLVQASGGTMTIASTPGLGTTVTLLLPEALEA